MSDKVYVTMRDRILSGWGCAIGRVSVVVLECDSMDEALIVKKNARNRTDMYNVRIAKRKPRYNSNTAHVEYHDKTTGYANFYVPNYFHIPILRHSEMHGRS